MMSLQTAAAACAGALFMPENDISPVGSTVHFRGASRAREGLQERAVLHASGSRAPLFGARFSEVVVRATFFNGGFRFGVGTGTRAVRAPCVEKSGQRRPCVWTFEMPWLASMRRY